MAKKNELMQKAYAKADYFEKNYGNCGQCVLAGLKEALADGIITDEVFKAATGLGGGIGLTGATCGGLVGGTLGLSSYCGRAYKDFSNNTLQRTGYALSRELIDKFMETYGSIKCWDIQTKIMGRSYDLRNPEELQAFIAAGGHDDKCPLVCGNSAQWVVEILFAHGYLSE